MTLTPDLTVIVPAHNEADVIGANLRALLNADGPKAVQVVIVANGCSDETAARVRDRVEAFAARGWQLELIELEAGSKIAALNAGDAAAAASARLYLDADVVVSPGLLLQIARRLSDAEAVYASGQLNIPEARTPATRAYRRIYAQVPFVTDGVPGAGVFALNGAARARWDAWPDIISDDTFARLNFAPTERHRVSASYDWPLVEGWRALVRVRRRQNAGVAEIAARFPDLLKNDDKRRLGAGAVLGMALRDPWGFAIYASVALATRFGRSTAWERGR